MRIVFSNNLRRLILIYLLSKDSRLKVLYEISENSFGYCPDSHWNVVQSSFSRNSSKCFPFFHFEQILRGLFYRVSLLLFSDLFRKSSEKFGLGIFFIHQNLLLIFIIQIRSNIFCDFFSRLLSNFCKTPFLEQFFVPNRIIRLYEEDVQWFLFP